MEEIVGVARKTNKATGGRQGGRGGRRQWGEEAEGFSPVVIETRGSRKR